MINKILISACLLGENVKYNGLNNQLNNSLIEEWKQENRLICACPEVLGGLSTPRLPSEINIKEKKVIRKDGLDVTLPFYFGSIRTLEIIEKYRIKIAILKENSPSCGVNKIYDGSFSKKLIDGVGVTTKILKNNGVMVFNEYQLDKVQKLLLQLEK